MYGRSVEREDRPDEQLGPDSVAPLLGLGAQRLEQALQHRLRPASRPPAGGAGRPARSVYLPWLHPYEKASLGLEQYGAVRGNGRAVSRSPADLNLLLAWVWITVGFLVGFWFGLNFHREEWLDGYTSLKRRMYRLAHISFFGLAIINLLFYFTVAALTPSGAIVTIASWGFLVGAVTMPVCCVAMAHKVDWRPWFLVPVISLAVAGMATIWMVMPR